MSVLCRSRLTERKSVARSISRPGCSAGTCARRATKKAMHERRRRVDADEASRRIVRAGPPERLDRRLHVTRRRERPGSGRRQDIAFRAPLDELFTQCRFERMDPARDRRVIDRERRARSREAAVPSQRKEDAKVLPVRLCAFFISH